MLILFKKCKSEMNYLCFCIVLCFIFGCNLQSRDARDFKKKADSLLEKIADGTANGEFSVKYFPIEQTEAIMYDLKNKCDFKSRQGHFLNEYYAADKSKVSLIYEYYLKCDSVRFILTYNCGDSVELYEFKMEPIEKENEMIVDPAKRLSY